MTEPTSKRRKTDAEAQECPYLDTINRTLLDFDFEPSCSVSLESGPHVYGCLVCGKFFRGRGKQTPAYTHSVNEGHFVFVHLSRGTFHCLPDNYEINDPSLADISAALHPTFAKDEIATIDANKSLARDIFGRRYLPGYVGLNNLHKTDYINATVQALAHVPPLRNYFLSLTHRDTYLPSKSKKKKPPHRISHLAMCFGELVRKIWSERRFKSHVDPHMLVQAITSASKKKFEVGVQGEAGEFMAWFLNQLHIGLGGTRKQKSSIVYEIFQGKVEVTTVKRKEKKIEAASEDGDGDKEGEGNDDGEKQTDDGADDVEEVSAESAFLQLTLDIPEKPLFRDDEGGLVIPQEPLVTVLKKFDGVTFSDALDKAGQAQRKRYRLLKLPDYLILHLARFKSNNYSREKNPTIVAFPVKNLDLSSYVAEETATSKKVKVPTEEEVRAMSVKELKELLNIHGCKHIAKDILEKQDLVETTVDFVTKSLPDLLTDKYDLVANITHESPSDVGREGKVDPLQEGSYRCHVQHRSDKQWYEMQDIHVKKTIPQLIGVSESYVLIFERKSAQFFQAHPKP